jgi:hypothetical protein
MPQPKEPIKQWIQFCGQQFTVKIETDFGIDYSNYVQDTLSIINDSDTDIMTRWSITMPTKLMKDPHEPFRGLSPLVLLLKTLTRRKRGIIRRIIDHHKLNKLARYLAKNAKHANRKTLIQAVINAM